MADEARVEKAPKKLPMTGWFNPAMLVQTAIRVSVSTVFGQFADRREAMAAANAIEPQPIDSSFTYEADADGTFWFDFLADTGDGWDSTLAMAQLATAATLTPTGSADALPRGRVLLLGGDQVYPTASKEAYEDRFLGPFDQAYEEVSEAGKAAMPDLYAVPGNHDWYDGLGSFFNLFCRRRIAAANTIGINRPGRPIAGRQTKQTRSYFAVNLPGGWWVWGTDSQLKGYIDQPQIDYFQHVASNWMKPGSKVILMVGQPNWAYVDEDHPEREFETFSYLERLAGIARKPLTKAEREEGKRERDQPLMGHKLKLVLTGDSHHYSRFTEASQAGAVKIHYLTCGGGGAFLHPTHQLRDKRFGWDYPAPGDMSPRTERGCPRSFEIADKEKAAGKALYPDAATSRGLTKGNLAFAFRNPGMSFVYAAAYLLYNWLLHANARIEGFGSLVQALGAESWPGALWRYVSLSFTSPLPSLLFAAAIGGYYYFADEPHNTPKRLKIGVFHGLLQTAAAIFVTASLIWLLGKIYLGAAMHPICMSLSEGLTVLVASLVAALVSGTIFGLYMWINLNRWGRHWNEAFSALAISGYKNFLRMKIDAEGNLHLYPIGLAEVTKGGGPAAALKPHLIEGPVRIA